jgi:imidazolonepropionase-like amidohydrolase
MTYEDAVATGRILGPRMMKTGPVIEYTPGQPKESIEEARDRMRRYAGVYQVRYIKEGTLIHRDVRQVRVMAAAERQLNVTACGHTFRQLIQNAIDGYGGYEHDWFGWPVYEDVRQLLAKTGITLAHEQHPTASPYLITKLDTGELSMLRQRWTADDSTKFATQPRARSAYALNWGRDSSLARIVAAGGRVSVGSHGNEPGYGIHFHMWMYAEGGMPVLDVLRTATLNSAQALGFDRDLGSLEVGKVADLVVLDKNPLEAITNTISVRQVLFNGRLYDSRTLDELWPRRVTREKAWWQ